MNRIFVSALIVSATTIAPAQWIHNVNRPLSNGGGAPYDIGTFQVNFANGTSTRANDFENYGVPLATAPGFRGLAGDDANGRFWGITDRLVGSTVTTDVYRIGYGGQAEFVAKANYQLPNGTAFMQLAGLAYDPLRGKLYSHNQSNRNFTTALGGWMFEGVYEIDVTTGAMTPKAFMESFTSGTTSTTNFNIRSIAYDDVTDRLYAVNFQNPSDTHVLAWDPVANTTSRVLTLSGLSWFTRAGLIGAGNGRLALMSESTTHNGGLHRTFNLVTQQWEDTAATAYGAYPTFVGSPTYPQGNLAYAPNFVPTPVPEPASALVLAGALALLRRRKKSPERLRNLPRIAGLLS